jgi:hypothetical protein
MNSQSELPAPAPTLWHRVLTFPLVQMVVATLFIAVPFGGASKGLLQSRMAGPDWLTGGKFGAEASVVALLVCAAAGIICVALAIQKGKFFPPFWAARLAPAFKAGRAAQRKPLER